MYTARKRKTDKLRNLLHRHKQQPGLSDTVSLQSYTDYHEQSSYAPTTRSQSVSPPQVHKVATKTVRFNTPPPSYEQHQSSSSSTPSSSSVQPPSASNFSADYERYMRTRNQNMERIKQLHDMNSSNTTNNSNTNILNKDDIMKLYSTNSTNNFNNYTSLSNIKPSTTQTGSGISSVEQELLAMADAPLPPYKSEFTTPMAAPVPIYNYTAPPQKSLLAPPPSSTLLSPRAELEKFSSAFSYTSQKPSSSYQRTSPTTTTTASSSTYQFPHPRYEIPVEYEQKHEKPQHRELSLSKEHSPNLRTVNPGSYMYELKNDPYNNISSELPSASNARRDDESLRSFYESKVESPLRNSQSGFKPSPISKETPSNVASTPARLNTPPPSSLSISPPALTSTPPSSSANNNNSVPAITVSEPIPTPTTTVTDKDGNPISLQEDLENLLQNLQEHFKRRPSGVPKAPPPSPADFISPLQSMLGEAIYPDFDFVRTDPLSISTSNSPRVGKVDRRSTLPPRSLTFDNSPSSSGRSSLASSQNLTPPDSTSSSPRQFRLSPVQSDSELNSPASPAPTTTTTSSSQPPQSTYLFSPPLPPPPPMSPIQHHGYPDLDSQGNFSMPPPPPLHNIDLQSLPPPIIPPPDFDYSAYDYQGNRLDRPHVDNDEVAEIEQTEANQIEQAEEIERTESIEDLAPLSVLPAEPIDSDPSTLHTTSFTTETNEDSYGKTVTSTITSNTATPSAILSTVSTATTTRTNTAIPTTPSEDRRDQPTVIETLSTTTTAVEPETGKVANARVVQTRVLHPGKESDDVPADVTTEYNEGFLPAKPAADAFSMSSLLDDIRNGKTLRKTPAPNYPSSTLALPSSSSATSSLSSSPDEDAARNALMATLASRRQHISDEDESEEEEDDEEVDW